MNFQIHGGLRFSWPIQKIFRVTMLVYWRSWLVGVKMSARGKDWVTVKTSNLLSHPRSITGIAQMRAPQGGRAIFSISALCSGVCPVLPGESRYRVWLPRRFIVLSEFSLFGSNSQICWMIYLKWIRKNINTVARMVFSRIPGVINRRVFPWLSCWLA